MLDGSDGAITVRVHHQRQLASAADGLLLWYKISVKKTFIPHICTVRHTTYCTKSWCRLHRTRHAQHTTPAAKIVITSWAYKSFVAVWLCGMQHWVVIVECMLVNTFQIPSLIQFQ